MGVCRAVDALDVPRVGREPVPGRRLGRRARLQLGANKAEYNPDGPDLVVVKNGTVGAVPQPGDVVSVGRPNRTSFGHTAVVTADAVDPQGNGTSHPDPAERRRRQRRMGHLSGRTTGSSATT